MPGIYGSATASHWGIAKILRAPRNRATCPLPASLHLRQRGTRQQRDHGVEMLGIGLEPDAEPAHDGDDRVVERRLHAQLLAVLAHGAVQIVDLGAPAAHDVLKQRRTAAAALPGDVGDVDEQLLQSPSLIRVAEALSRNA